ncbi:hypothetical protein BD410DRAFT_792859, partial [Rickenella mellea]
YTGASYLKFGTTSISSDILRFRRSRPTCISDYQFVITPTTNPHIIEAARV